MKDKILDYFRKYGPQPMRHVKTYGTWLGINNTEVYRIVWSLIDDNQLIMTPNREIDIRR